MTNGRRRAGARRAVGLLALVTVPACSDPPPDPSTAPIEVVANSRAKPDEACLLNRESLGAGTHELVVIAESAPALVRVQDREGVALLEVEVGQGATKSSTVELEAGVYTVSCSDVSGSPVTSVSLRVDGDGD